jgi:hypothetical protein
VLPQKLRFLYIVGAKDKQVIDNLYIKTNLLIVESTLNVYPHKEKKACIIYLLKNQSEITQDE